MRVARALVLVTTLLSLALSTACSRGVNDEAVPPRWVEFVEQYCSLLTPCCPMPSDGAHCRERLASYRAASLEPTQGAVACLNALRVAAAHGASCEDGFQVCDVYDLASAVVVDGTKAIGESCDSVTNDCAQTGDIPVRCATSYVGMDGAVSGRCLAVVRYGRAGDGPCIGTQEGHASDTGLGITAGATQQQYLCDAAEGLWCAGDGVPTCQPVVLLGGSCHPSMFAGTVSFECGVHARCDVKTLRCAPAARRGQPCGEGCDGNAACVLGTCKSDQGLCTDTSQCSTVCRNGACSFSTVSSSLFNALACGP